MFQEKKDIRRHKLSEDVTLLIHKGNLNFPFYLLEEWNDKKQAAEELQQKSQQLSKRILSQKMRIAREETRLAEMVAELAELEN